MSEEKAKFYFIQVLLGIQHIHDKSVIYRDLKP
jgi:serum/glucocorticoid-regulated kinase 2